MTRTRCRLAGMLVLGALVARGVVACIYPTDGYREAGRHLDLPPAPSTPPDTGAETSSGDDSSSVQDTATAPDTKD